MKQWLRTLPRNTKRHIALGFDVVGLPLALWLAVCLRLGTVVMPGWEQAWIYVLVVLIAVPVFIKMGLYRAIVHYMEMSAFFTITKAVTLSVGVWGLILLFTAPFGVPRSSIIIFWLLALLLIAGSRLFMRWLLGSSQGEQKRKVAVYGAGKAGVQLAQSLRMSHKFKPVCFFDDNPELHGHEVVGLPVHARTEMREAIESLDISHVFVAMPSASRRQKQSVLDALEPLPVKVKILPDLDDIAGGEVSISQVRDVEISDLLGRSEAKPDEKLMAHCIRDKVVMVTGAGGSIGSELCRQILRRQPETLVLFERSEYALYTIEHELRDLASKLDVSCALIPILGSVHHRRRVAEVCRAFCVQTVYHAAAYKHVPLVEFNPVEGVHNNILGTLHTVQAAIESGVEHFVLVSTDKAVRPTNVMGATKRCAELVLQALHERGSGNTCLSMVRFGNVLGSSGSVVPLFRKQIREGGPITLTHKDVMRYFMTIPEAAQLVIQAGAMARGGEVFVLDMGEPVKIADLARRLVHLSGLTVRDAEHPEGDIEIVETGLRPGEKLYEELLIGDKVEGTSHPLIMRAMEESLPWEELEKLLHAIQQASQAFDVAGIRTILQQLVRGYRPNEEIHDLLWRRAPEAAKMLRSHETAH